MERFTFSGHSPRPSPARLHNLTRHEHDAERNTGLDGSLWDVNPSECRRALSQAVRRREGGHRCHDTAQGVRHTLKAIVNSGTHVVLEGQIRCR
jgi:hypothetical protein